MSARPIPDLPVRPVAIDSSHISTSPGLWDRLSQWASENKAIVYTVGAVAVVVTGAGVVYYLSDSRDAARRDERELGLADEKKKSKKDRRKAKKQVAEGKKDEQAKAVEETRESLSSAGGDSD